jgi:hypothetical protein
LNNLQGSAPQADKAPYLGKVWGKQDLKVMAGRNTVATDDPSVVRARRLPV